MSKPLVVYHANCADGFGAAFAAWTVFGDEAEYLPIKHNTPPHEHMPSFIEACGGIEGRAIYMVDFSLKTREMMDHLLATTGVVWLDHHKTAFEMWRGEYSRGMTYADGDDDAYQRGHYILLDDNKSGAYLAWEYFHPDDEVPMLIKHIDDYDRWQFKIEGTKEFNKALWSAQSWNFPQWKELLESDIRPMYKAGKAILCAHEQNVQAVVKGAARPCKLSTFSPDSYGAMFDGLAANCPSHLTSDVGHELATKSGTYGLLWTLGKEGMIANCSLRSNGDYDVSAIAKSLGGGGHQNAAGFEVPIETLLGWLK